MLACPPMEPLSELKQFPRQVHQSNKQDDELERQAHGTPYDMVKRIVIGHEREGGECDAKHNRSSNKHSPTRLSAVPATGEASNGDGHSTFPFVLDPFDDRVGLDFRHVNVVGLAASPPAPFSAWCLFSGK